MATNTVAAKTPPYHPAVFRHIYVWEFPVRLFHWVNALCVVVLGATGYLIGHPVTIAYANEAYQQYWFGTVRFLHFMTAYVLFFNFFIRVYWAFVGNVYARWTNFLPLKKQQWRDIFQVLQVDILQTRTRGFISIGHNALAAVIYFLFFLAFLFQVVTGFALYSSMSQSWVPKMFSWARPLMGGDFALRQWHHAMMWFFILFTLVHVYLVFYHDYIEGRGTTSSMVGGWKFEREKPKK